MHDVSDIDLGRRARRLRVETIVRLRWLAVGGQSVAVVAVQYGLGFELPFVSCLLTIGMSVVLNFGLRLKYPINQRLDDGPASILLAYDVAQLSLLLYLTGGLQNPFAMLFLAPVMISAASLSPPRTLGLALMTVAAATLLVFFRMPLPWFSGQVLTMPYLYVAGVWFAVVLGTAFIGVYASLVAEEARRLSDALAATELVLAREQHLSQLDGYAAAAAHELGTPLATITLAIRELSTSVHPNDAIREDIVLIDQEVKRCRAILSKLASLANEGAGPLDEMTLGHLLEEVVEPHREFGVDVEVVRLGEGAEPVCRRNPGVLYGLGNMIENAVDFAKGRVRVVARSSEESVSIRFEGDGPGFASDVLARLGDPYVTSRGLDRRAKSDPDAGLGLGLFIAKTLLERSGASIATSNVLPPGSGAIVEISWSRAAFERGRDINRLSRKPVEAGANPAFAR